MLSHWDKECEVRSCGLFAGVGAVAESVCRFVLCLCWDASSVTTCVLVICVPRREPCDTIACPRCPASTHTRPPTGCDDGCDDGWLCSEGCRAIHFQANELSGSIPDGIGELSKLT